MTLRELPPAVLARRGVVYVRPSTGVQLRENLESRRRQYELANLAPSCGSHEVTVIDEDLWRSASGTVDRPGFRALVGQICEGGVAPSCALRRPAWPATDASGTTCWSCADWLARG